MPSKILFAAGAAAIAALAAAPSFAGEHGHVRVMRGWGGRAVETRHVDRTSSGATVTRNYQTSYGTGVKATRTTSHGDGTFDSTRTYAFDNRPEAGRSLSLHNNGDGTASYTRTVAHPSGVVTEKSGTVTYP
jgi:hypothetical protein